MKELVPAQRCEDAFARQRTRSIPRRMPPDVRAKGILEILTLLSLLALLYGSENRGPQRARGLPGAGALPDFQNSVVPFQGLQEGFCPKAGDAIVGEPGEEDGMVSFGDARVSSWACPIKGSFGGWPAERSHPPQPRPSPHGEGPCPLSPPPGVP